MNCPACKTDGLTPSRIEESLIAMVCPQCEGKWITTKEYETWRTAHGENLPIKPPGDEPLDLWEVETARVCPFCQRILLKYNVGHQTGFMLDRCSDCGGVWFDSQEWETMKDRNLHDDLQDVFSDRWQTEVRRLEAQKNADRINEKKFGADDYVTIKNFKAWMDSHARRNEILAFLNNETLNT